MVPVLLARLQGRVRSSVELRVRFTGWERKAETDSGSRLKAARVERHLHVGDQKSAPEVERQGGASGNGARGEGGAGEGQGDPMGPSSRQGDQQRARGFAPAPVLFPRLFLRSRGREGCTSACPGCGRHRGTH